MKNGLTMLHFDSLHRRKWNARARRNQRMMHRQQNSRHVVTIVPLLCCAFSHSPSVTAFHHVTLSAGRKPTFARNSQDPFATFQEGLTHNEQRRVVLESRRSKEESPFWSRSDIKRPELSKKLENESVNFDVLEAVRTKAAALFATSLASIILAGCFFFHGSAYAETPSAEASAVAGSEEIRPGVLDEVWRLTNKYYIDRTFKNQNWSKVREKYEALDDHPPQDGTKSMKLATDMVATLGDKYSRILDAASYERIQKYDLIGVGATLMPTPDKRIAVSAPPVPGSAADKEGLKVGDYIMAVNGVPTAGRTSFDIIDQIQENPNAPTIKFSVLTPDKDSTTTDASTTNNDKDSPKKEPKGDLRDVVLERSFVEVKDPIFYNLQFRKTDTKSAWASQSPPVSRVGYVRIKEFNSLVKTKLLDALVDLERRGANGYVLDLRSNPGGAFQSAVESAGLFLNGKIATYVLDNNQVKLPFLTSPNGAVVDPSHPVVLWIDKGSASAAEVFAGALHDNCRGVVMGETKSFGKGLIQAVYGLQNGSGFVLTVATYITPEGTEIQGYGITPDLKTSLPFVPGFTSDTSKVNFDEVASVQSKLCSAVEKDAGQEVILGKEGTGG